jgi:hypothetical protein
MIWLVIMAAETVHGVVRGLFLVPRVGDLAARQIGVLVGSLIIIVGAYFCRRWLAARTTSQLLVVGLLWVTLTILFEIGLGYFVLGLPWERIAADFQPERGGFLAFGLLFMALAPWLADKLRGT